MNTRVIFWASVAIVSLLVCVKTPLLAMVFALLIMGIIPGTGAVVPAWIMLLIYPLVFVGAIIWLTRQSLLVGAPQQPKLSRAKTVSPKKKRSPQAKTSSRRYRAAKGQKA